MAGSITYMIQSVQELQKAFGNQLQIRELNFAYSADANTLDPRQGFWHSGWVHFERKPIGPLDPDEDKSQLVSAETPEPDGDGSHERPYRYDFSKDPILCEIDPLAVAPDQNESWSNSVISILALSVGYPKQFLRALKRQNLTREQIEKVALQLATDRFSK